MSGNSSVFYKLRTGGTSHTEKEHPEGDSSMMPEAAGGDSRDRLINGALLKPDSKPGPRFSCSHQW